MNSLYVNMFVKNNFYKTEWRYFYIFASENMWYLIALIFIFPMTIEFE